MREASRAPQCTAMHPDASHVHRVSDLPPPAGWGTCRSAIRTGYRKARPAGADRRRREREGGTSMKDFSGRIAVVTGGGSGMGRELVRLLVAEGCAIAMCDVSPRGMAETRRLCEVAGLPQGLRLTSHVADVSNEADVLRFRDEVAAQHASDRIHLLFNNAGISGGGSMIVNERAEWERTFNICWGGVYLNTRAFLPMLRAADEAHIVNTSSMNGFWASVGPDTPHTAYSAAKFAVKGFTEALIADFRMNAPHIKVSVVMPGHIGTGIRDNSLKVQTGTDADGLNAAQIGQIRTRLTSMGRDPSKYSDADIERMHAERAQRFVSDAPTSAAEAAKIILDGVRADRLRILVGPDAHIIDRMVREDPDHAYDLEFYERFATEAGWYAGR
jgi:NAD(P)-dependent dehydrogenase (short-subunit alcohol dehydrogenase family)